MFVESVHRDARHRFTKPPAPDIELVAGHGVRGDAHFGTTVQHRSRKRWRPHEPNLRQVHLIPGELLDELVARGYDLAPGVLGENVTTRGLDLQAHPVGTQLDLGDQAQVELTGLRNPCVQIDRSRPGLLAEVVGTDDDGHVWRRAGVMAVVRRHGVVRPGDPIRVRLPDAPHHGLAVV